MSQTVATSKPQKLLQNSGVLCIDILYNLLSQRRAFFDNWTSRIGRGMRCFVHFDLKICFAPEQRAIFRHLNCRKWPGAGILTCKCASCNSGVPFLGRPTSKSGPRPSVFFAFWLIALGAKAACKFLDILTSKRLKPVCFLHILACKCASCNSGVQFFISPLKTWVSKGSFSEPTFRHPRTIGKTRRIATFLTLCAAVSSFYSSIFFWFYFLLTLLLCSAFHLSILSEVRLLNFLRSVFWCLCSQS